MQTQVIEPIEVLRQSVDGQRPMDGEVVSSVALLAEKLQYLKSQNPMFEAISFSPDIEIMMAADIAAVMN